MMTRHLGYAACMGRPALEGSHLEKDSHIIAEFHPDVRLHSQTGNHMFRGCWPFTNHTETSMVCVPGLEVTVVLFSYNS